MPKCYDLSKVSILVVEDNTFMASIIKTYLREFGVGTISAASDGAEALERVSSVNPDLIITDCKMPSLDGIDLTKLVRTAPDSPNPEVPIIMITAFSDRRRIIEARDAGVTEILRKPIAAIELFRRIVEVVERPRAFARSKSFTGPSRRRRTNEGRAGPERRRVQPKTE